MHFDINKQQFNTDMFSHISLLLSQWTIYGSKGNSGYHCLVNSILKRILIKTEVLEVGSQIILNPRFTIF